MKNTRFIITTVLAAILILFSMSCSNEDEYIEGTSASTGSIRVLTYQTPTGYEGLDGTSTVQAPVIESVMLIAEKNGEKEAVSETECPVILPYLEEGEWNCYIQLYDKNGDILGKTDAVKVLVEAGKRTSLNLGEPEYCNLMFGITSSGYIRLRPYILDGTVTLGKQNALDESGKLTIPDKVSIDASNSIKVKGIASNGFEGWTILKTVEIPSYIKSIGSNAFASTNLTAMVIPATVDSIGSGAFQNCTSLTEVTVNNAGIIDNYLFKGCLNLKTVVIPESVSSIGTGSFENCSSLEKITTDKDSVGNKLPSNLQKIGAGAFLNCAALTEFVLPKPESRSLVIKERAFKGCTKLASVVLNDQIAEIGSNAFEGTAIKEISLPDNAKFMAIKEGLFLNCTNLIKVDIPDNVVTIGNNAFSNSKGIVNLYIPASVRVIDYKAFASWTDASTIEFEISEATADTLNFDNMWKDGCEAKIKWGKK